MGKQQYGIDPEAAVLYAREVKSIVEAGKEVAIVIGGGNIFRGLNAEKSGIDRVQGSAFEMKEVSEPYIRRRAVRHLEKGRVVIFGAGTGNPYFTTDTAAALRATEINADVILKGTRVDGVYSADPEKNPDATRFDEITFQNVLDKELKVMDLTAFTMCKENNLPIIIFDINEKGNLLKIVNGEKIGTLVH